MTDEHNALWTNINVGKERLSTWNGDRIFLTAGQQSGIDMDAATVEALEKFREIYLGAEAKNEQ